jgi:hypothetical protein
MSRYLALASAVLGLPLMSCTLDDAGAQPVASTDQAIGSDACPANTPAALAPTADQDLAFVLDAQGVQRYQCVQSTTGYAWTFVAPDADLFTGHPHESAVHHFAGPAWLYRDSSSVLGAKVAGVSVDATAIPWLLLTVSKHGGGDGRLSDVTSIQRLETTGGLAPATGCDADHVGMGFDANYTARYFFYRTSSRPNNTRCGG